jgi:hypothetical protein
MKRGQRIKGILGGPITEGLLVMSFISIHNTIESLRSMGSVILDAWNGFVHHVSAQSS